MTEVGVGLELMLAVEGFNEVGRELAEGEVYEGIGVPMTLQNWCLLIGLQCLQKQLIH